MYNDVTVPLFPRIVCVYIGYKVGTPVMVIILLYLTLCLEQRIATLVAFIASTLISLCVLFGTMHMANRDGLSKVKIAFVCLWLGNMGGSLYWLWQGIR